MNASDLLNFLACLTIVAVDASDREDAEDMAEFWWTGSPGARLHLADGRVLARL